MHDAGDYFPKTGMPMLKHYLDEMPGVPLQTFWDDIKPVISGRRRTLGLSDAEAPGLLERIIQSEQQRKRHRARCVLRLRHRACRGAEAEASMDRHRHFADRLPRDGQAIEERLRIERRRKALEIGRGFVVRDLPKTEAELRKYPPFEFENWAVVALGGIPNKAQVGDMGIDGRIYPVSAMPGSASHENGEMDFMDEWYPIQVKQTDKVGRPDIDAFETAMQRAERKLGYFVGFEFSRDALFEIDRFRRQTGCEIKPLTVREILDEEIARSWHKGNAPPKNETNSASGSC